MASSINSTSAGNGGLISTGDDSGILNIQTNETTAITVDASQNVGIGTVSPSTKLHVYTATGQNINYIETAGSGNDAGIYFKNTARIWSTFVNGGDGAYRIYDTTAGTERMRIDSSGMLGIGTTSAASSRLSISGTATLCMMKNESATSGTAQTTILFRDNGDNTRGSITVSTSGTVYNTTSDYRLKENITPMIGALAKISQLKPVTYKWKETGDSGQGFIAHELAEVVPECVTGEKDAVETRDGKEFIVPQGIDTSFLVATLTAALQEQQALITAQAETINALTARIVALEGQ